MPKKAEHETTHDHEEDNGFSDFQSPDEASVNRLIIALDRAYHQPRLLMWRAFLQGFTAAIGAFIGSAFIVIVSAYLFQALGGLGLLKPYVDKIQDATSTKTQQSHSPSN